MIVVVGVVAGLLLWSFLEYFLHRFVFHQRWFGARFSRDHGLHHARVDWFAPHARKIGISAPVIGATLAIGAVFGGGGAGLGAAGGLLAGWGFYEVLHRQIHVAAPRGLYGDWARRHHLAHHFGNPSANHGVTSPIWDVVFGTLVPCDVVDVPARHLGKLPWLADRSDEGRVAPAFSARYRLA